MPIKNIIYRIKLNINKFIYFGLREYNVKNIGAIKKLR
jgi:hypothetical protein